MRYFTKCTLYYNYITPTLLVKQKFKNFSDICRFVLGHCLAAGFSCLVPEAGGSGAAPSCQTHINGSLAATPGMPSSARETRFLSHPRPAGARDVNRIACLAEKPHEMEGIGAFALKSGGHLEII